MKILVLSLLLVLPSLSKAEVSEVSVLCKRDKKSDCTRRVLEAFQKLECSPDVQTVQCGDATKDPMIDPQEIRSLIGKDLCQIQSECREPRYGNFGSVECSIGKKGRVKEVDLKSVDRGLSLTVSVGFFRSPVTKLCKWN
ncbi:MAG: hypothetical protein M9962_12570 [Oligoflexia bacterium]|nr:hypothetical protein [Oligoflexia bacterium]